MKLSSLLLALVPSVVANQLSDILTRSDVFATPYGPHLKARAIESPPYGESFPVIDLGYAKHEASSYATTGDVSYYVFKNIRFAAPPTGELRFRAPRPPLKQHGIQNGTVAGPTNCASLDDTGKPIGSEDCLFLDVYMPVRKNGRPIKKPMPVLANWYGGGYLVGAKETAGSPETLYATTGEPFVYIAPNYRLGAFGWLAPPGADWTPNAGLHDTIAAMTWMKKYMRRFRGDPTRVTAMGLSAGAGVVLHALVADTERPLPFQQALLQSPGWQPEMNVAGRAPLYAAFAAAANCTPATEACLRAAPSAALLAANARTIAASQSGALGVTSGFYPVADGDLLPRTVADTPISNFAPLRSVIASSARWEAGTGTFAPKGSTDADFLASLATFTSSPRAQRIIAALYPSDGSPDSGYKRGRDVVGDIGFNCNTYWTNLAYAKSGRKYEFNIGAAGHGSDGPYTWDPTLQGGTVTDHRRWISEYVVRGSPERKWPLWKQEDGTALWLNDTGPAVGADYYRNELNRHRCEVLRKAIYGKS
ncbi:Alpha/Beta hydrolase protein [Geopyxis carbonaria]|nr:Alpha/Beta hydrolase protein [Geopyxis carbonaria]